MTTFVKLFRHHPEPSEKHSEKYGDVSIPIDDQINDFIKEWMKDAEGITLNIKQITYIPFHMSLTVEALVLFEISNK